MWKTPKSASFLLRQILNSKNQASLPKFFMNFIYKFLNILQSLSSKILNPFILFVSIVLNWFLRIFIVPIYSFLKLILIIFTFLIFIFPLWNILDQANVLPVRSILFQKMLVSFEFWFDAWYRMQSIYRCKNNLFKLYIIR